MSYLKLTLLWVCCLAANARSINSSDETSVRRPSVLLAVLSRNEQHSLPSFLACIEDIRYPKERISIFIQTDHNSDNTSSLLLQWSKYAEKYYHSVTLHVDEAEKLYKDADHINEWSSMRYEHVMNLRQNALLKAREDWADYLFVVDGDNFLVNPDVLNLLMARQKTVIAPMLRMFDGNSGYSNFWGAMDENGYYKRVPEYFEILNREKSGVFPVPMVHSTYLVDLQRVVTDKLQYHPPPDGYMGENDDILVFAHSVKQAGITMYIDNQHLYGYLLHSGSYGTTLREKQQHFTDSLVEYIAYNEPLKRSRYVDHHFPLVDNLGFDEIYMINLVRRKDRREKMLDSLKELGMAAKWFPAVDGKTLSHDMLEEMGIRPMMDFKDPYLERPLTMGEVGCFLSHWKIWNEMIERDLEMVLILEDDARFVFDFKRKFSAVMQEARLLLETQNWDLMYIGRKRMSRDSEEFVPGASKIVFAKYSYWTLGYVLRLSGAKKLVAGKPLQQLIPVDEYIPIMFNSHSDKQLLEKFGPRDLIGLSAEPLLIFPTHYTGEPGYISDTEDTPTITGEDTQHFRDAKSRNPVTETSPGYLRADPGPSHSDGAHTDL